MKNSLHKKLYDEHSKKFQELFQINFSFLDEKIDGGIIVANGKSNIDDINSDLHKRATVI